jgi:uncharacterized protein with HEPN domain/predicted nucleotidyltransferase
VLSEKYNIHSLGVFGSYVRGEQTPTSDLDLLVEYRENTPYEKRFGFYQFLRKQFGSEIDLIENRNLKPYIGRLVRPQVIWLQKDGVPQSLKMPRFKAQGKRKASNGANVPAKSEHLDFFQDMLNAMDRATRYIRGMTLEQVLEDDKTLDAMSYALQTVGEAANRIPCEIEDCYPDIPWHDMIGMRHWIAHGYDRIDYDKFWISLTVSIPRDQPLVAVALAAEKKRRKLDA